MQRGRNMRMEYKTFGYDVKELGDDGIFKGYASVFGNVDSVGDRVLKGCFSVSIAKHGGKVPILKSHDPHSEIGLGVLAREDDIGLYVDGRLNMDVQDAREQKSLAKQHAESGMPMGLSIGYFPIDFVYEKDGTRTLKSVDWIEYSLTPFPANNLAGVTSIKSLLEGKNELEIAHKKREIEDFLRGAGCSSKQAKSAVSAIFGDEEEEKKVSDSAELNVKLREIAEMFGKPNY